ncbi:MAG: dUTP diphosphatase [Clostridiales bacterium]|nr:dUTP diphosphatase [Clostridiales bacterium]
MERKFYVTKTDDAKDLPLPKYMSDGAAGMDLYANVHEDTLIRHGEIKLIPTGIKIALPEGYEAQIRPRSGLALKYGITLLNSPGTIDSDYRGEIGIIMANCGNNGFLIRRGDRIAQMVINIYE